MKKISSLTVCIIAKNEERHIRKVIQSVKHAEKVIVIDDYSTDRTVTLSKDAGAIVYKRHLSENFAAQRNFALRKATTPWVLFIDADEYVSDRLMNEISTKIANSELSGYFILRKDEWMGKVLNKAEWGNQWLLRLGRKENGLWTRPIHETWSLRGKVGKLNEPLIHSSHASVFEFLEQIAFHSRLHSREHTKRYKSVSIWKVILNPIGKFLVNWFVKRGYKDGTRGLIYAVFMSLHSFLAWSQLYISSHEK